MSPRREPPAEDALFAAETHARERDREERDASFLSRPARVSAGVDEAGLGPLLGPLTIGYSAFRAPSSIDLWQALRAVATRNPESDERRLVVADSKVVFTRNPRGERRLEATALCFQSLCAQDGRFPASGRALLGDIPHDLRPQDGFEREAWFAFLAERLPAHAEHGALERLAHRLRSSLAEAEVEISCAGMRVLPVGELNASFEATSNKSLTHWSVSAAVLRHLWKRHGHEGLEVLVDRHGGRMRYGWLLRETFLGAHVHVLREVPVRSDYFVEEAARGAEPARWMRIAFMEKAENASFAVALASCIAKYARETCMRAFNAYFASLQPGLKPTAGYTTDGWRWLAEARAAIERSGLARAALVRER